MELVSTHHCGTGEVPYRCPKCFLPMDIVPPIWHCTIPPLRHTSVPHRCPKRNTSFMITHLCGTGYHPSLWYGNVPYRCPRYNVLRCIYPCIWYGGWPIIAALEQCHIGVPNGADSLLLNSTNVARRQPHLCGANTPHIPVPTRQMNGKCPHNPHNLNDNKAILRQEIPSSILFSRWNTLASFAPMGPSSDDADLQRRCPLTPQGLTALWTRYRRWRYDEAKKRN